MLCILRERKCLIGPKPSDQSQKLGISIFLIVSILQAPTFMRLLNRKMPDNVDVLVKDDQSEVTSQEEINRAVVKFYKELC